MEKAALGGCSRLNRSVRLEGHARETDRQCHSGWHLIAGSPDSSMDEKLQMDGLRNTRQLDAGMSVGGLVKGLGLKGVRSN